MAVENPRVELQIPHGRYNSISHIIKEINEAVTQKAQEHIFKSIALYDDESVMAFADLKKTLNPEELAMRTRRVQLPISKWPIVCMENTTAVIKLNSKCSIKFDKYIAALLGFTTKEIINSTNSSTTIKATHASESTDVKLQHLYVYCDVIENVPVGDTEAPLLRIVNSRKSDTEVVHLSFDPPRYIPLQRKNFDSIEIDIRTDLGDPVPFSTRKLVTTLHFRRASNQYFL